METISPTLPQILATGIFALAVLHTFSVKLFARMAHRQPHHAGLWHLLGEVEVVFGLWALVMVLAWVAIANDAGALDYLNSRDYTEPMFVFVIMVMAASRPVLHLAGQLVRLIAQAIPLDGRLARFFLALSFLPLLGSLITEPAAMTVAALLLHGQYFNHALSRRLQYATVAVLFVNVSIGGTLTSFAAPPVLMVAKPWGWDSLYMFSHFGWRAAVAVFANAAILTFLFRKEIVSQNAPADEAPAASPMPLAVVLVHLGFLVAVVTFAHYPVVFMGLFLFFLGYADAYRRHQDRLYLREGLMVAFFLAGLVTLGGLQKWWLQALLSGVDADLLYFLATALTAVTDNAALTYLGTQVDGLSTEFKHALLAGAVTGGGLTVIANAPNPAGYAILKGNFHQGAISPLPLFLAALPPTAMAIIAFRVL